MATVSRFGEPCRFYTAVVLLDGEPVPASKHERAGGWNRRDVLAESKQSALKALVNKRHPGLLQAESAVGGRYMTHIVNRESFESDDEEGPPGDRQTDPQFLHYCDVGIPTDEYIRSLNAPATATMRASFSRRVSAATAEAKSALYRGEVLVQIALYGFPSTTEASRYSTGRFLDHRLKGVKHWIPPEYFLGMYSLTNKGQLRHDVSYS